MCFFLYDPSTSYQALYHLYLAASQKIPLLTQELVELVGQAASFSGNDGDDSQSQPPEILTELCTGMQQVAAQIELSVELAEAVLDLDRAPRDFMVKATYKDELSQIQQDIDDNLVEMEEHHAEMNEIWARTAGGGNNNAVRLETESGTMEWQFRLTDTNCSKILQKQLGSTVTVHRILKNGVYFSTKRLRELSSARLQFSSEYDRQQRVVVLDALKVAATYSSILQRASEYVAQIDALASLAHMAAYNAQGYCRPILTDSEDNGNGIVLKGARHPCVELQENVEFIPNDVDLVFGESSFKIVTGPNMGGVRHHDFLGSLPFCAVSLFSL
jgi:DNA mismatch repair protein MSH2